MAGVPSVADGRKVEAKVDASPISGIGKDISRLSLPRGKLKD
jgi:hypothetical protein